MPGTDTIHTWQGEPGILRSGSGEMDTGLLHTATLPPVPKLGAVGLP